MRKVKQNYLVTGINWVAIIFAISLKLTIVPYMVFSSIQYSRFFILSLIVVELLALLVNKLYGVKLSLSFIKFLPLSCYFILWLIQLTIVFFLMNIKYIGAGLFFMLNDLFLCILVWSLIQNRARNKKSNVILKEYTFFAVFNAILVFVSAVLMTTHVLNPFTNDVSSMCVLFEGNVEAGQRYFWPGYISLQDDTMRLTEFGELIGLAMEPNALGLLIFPAFFFLIPNVLEMNFLYKLAFFALFAVSAIYGFSVTAFLSLSICLFFFFVRSGRKSILKLLIFLFVVVLFVVVFWDVIVQSVIMDYTRTKMFDSTSSADYSKENLELLFTPNSIIGGGIMFWPLYSSEEPNIGLVSFVFVVAYYFFSYWYSIKAIFSKNEIVMFVGLGALYMMLHSMKIAQAAFFMPFVPMCLVILYSVQKNNYKKTDNVINYKKYESIASNK